MPTARKTAVVLFTLPGDRTHPKGEMVESRPLTREREYGVHLSIGDHVFPTGFFQSPRNDEQWRDFVKRLRNCNVNRNEDGHRGAVFIRSFGADLYQKLAGLSPKLREFLSDTGTPRRLVIQTYRPELHLLPWSALYDEDGKFVASGDVSIVQAWDDFSLEPALFPADLKVRANLSADTPKNTAMALKSLPAEWTSGNPRDPDILHIEAHGDAVSNEIGKDGPWEIADRFAGAKMALLWSCYSSAANSWGESPALCLHRRSTAMVLSFLAELHNLDAKSIAEAFYSDVFGAAASRDPESALVRIRSDKFKNEFDYAAWASMTVYLRSPLDLSSLPLNGPRLPASGWSDADAEASWAPVSTAVGLLGPGARVALTSPAEPSSRLPRSAFAGWNGTVIRVDGDANPVSDACVEELGLSRNDGPHPHPAEHLKWLFGEIARYGQPLIVWTNSSPRHLEFLKTIKPSARLTFLLLYEAKRELSVPELVDEDQIDEALKRSENELPSSGEAGDEYWNAVYYARARSEKVDECRKAIGNISGPVERLLASGNFVSRFGQPPEADGESLTHLEKHQRQEEYYRQAINEAVQDGNNLRDWARAKLELGYLLQGRGETEAADLAYLAAAQALERTPEKSSAQPRLFRDSRWHSALGRALRDRAELLSSDPNRLLEASDLLRRALAIHAYHGRTLQVAYCRTAGARIDLASGRFADGVRRAMDAANDFESLKNWRAWAKAIEVLLDILAETRETSRMIALADLALDKIGGSNLPQKQKEDQTYTFNLKIAEALFTAGDIKAARTKMKELQGQPPAKLKAEADRLRRFLAIEQ
jgi:tetratricopeptide (TPR) repeat protein